MKPKILLIDPPFYRLFKDTYTLHRYPLSLGYLACTIKRDTNWEVMTYNAEYNLIDPMCTEPYNIGYMASEGFDNYTNNINDTSKLIWQEIKVAIEKYGPQVVGISIKTQNFASARRVAEIVKNLNPETIVVAGGPHPTMVGAEVLNYNVFDICVIGEGEQTIVELLHAINKRTRLSEVKGLVYNENGRIVKTGKRELLENLDLLCFPHRKAPEVLKDHDRYLPQAFKNIFSTRGCPYNCFFCGTHKIWGNKVRFRSPQNVVEEIRSLLEKGVPSIYFSDDTFGVTPAYINELCGAIAKSFPNLEWGCEIHVKLINDSNLRAMKNAGCNHINLGIESGNDDILKKIRKGITANEALSACKLIKKYNIELYTYFMIGFPWESEETIRDTWNLMRKTHSKLFLSVFTPYPGTEAFEYCKQQGLIADNYDYSMHFHQSPANYFCPNIEQGRFKELFLKMAKEVDKINGDTPGRIKLNRIKSLFSLAKVQKAREIGVRQSFKKFFNILRVPRH